MLNASRSTVTAILVLFMTLFGCSTTQRVSVVSGCLNQKYVTQTVQMLSTIIDTVAAKEGKNTSQESPQKLEALCNKEVYSKAGYRLLISKKPGTQEDVNGVFRTEDQVLTPEAARSCLHKAETDINHMQFEAGTRALQAYKTSYPELYDDPDLGPVKWLRCKVSEQNDYYDSLSTLAHELSHELRKADCLFPSFNSSAICFDLDPSLPKRSLGLISKFPTEDQKKVEFLRMMQKIYLTDADQPPSWLFDELNAYTITANGIARDLSTRGRSEFYRQDGTRNIVLLPMFLVITANYLIRLESQDPVGFENNFGAAGSNRSNLRSLLNASAIAFLNWDQIRRRSKVNTVDFETGFWNEYLALKDSRALKAILRP